MVSDLHRAAFKKALRTQFADDPFVSEATALYDTLEDRFDAGAKQVDFHDGKIVGLKEVSRLFLPLDMILAVEPSLYRMLSVRIKSDGSETILTTENFSTRLSYIAAGERIITRLQRGAPKARPYLRLVT